MSADTPVIPRSWFWQRRLASPGGLALMMLFMFGMVLAWVPVTAMLTASWLGYEQWGWKGAGLVALGFLLAPLLLFVRQLFAAWSRHDRPVLIPALWLVLGWMAGHVMTVQWVLVSTQHDTLGTLIDYTTVSARLPSFTGQEDTWYDAEGQLRPLQRQAWCDTTRLVIDVYRNQAQLHRDSGAGLRAMTATTLLAVQHQYGCLDDEVYITQRAEMTDVVKNVRSRHEALIEELAFLPLYDHLHEARTALDALVPLTQKAWCAAHVHRENQGRPTPLMSRCAGLPEDEVRSAADAQKALLSVGF